MPCALKLTLQTTFLPTRIPSSTYWMALLTKIQWELPKSMLSTKCVGSSRSSRTIDSTITNISDFLLRSMPIKQGIGLKHLYGTTMQPRRRVRCKRPFPSLSSTTIESKHTDDGTNEQPWQTPSPWSQFN